MLTNRDVEFAAMNFKKLAGQRIKAARLAKLDDDGIPWSQATLSEKMPWAKEGPQGRIGNYESGTRYPDPGTLVALQDLLGEPAAYLAALLSEEESVLLRAFYRMDQHDREDMLAFAKRRNTFTVPEPPDFLAGSPGAAITRRRRRKRQP